jgi:hypothetical protein
MSFTFAQRSSVVELPPSVEPVGITLFLFLSSQVFPQLASLALNRIGLLLRRLVDYWQLFRNLLRAPLQPNQCSATLFIPRLYVVRVTSAFRALLYHLTSLFVTIATNSNITIEFSLDRRLVVPKHFGNLRDGLLNLRKAGNLIYLSLASIGVFIRQFQLSDLEAFDSIYPQPTYP